MKRYVAVPGILLATLVSGCFYELRDEWQEHKIGWANRQSANWAWKDSESACLGMSCPHSFKEGFMSGYIDVANGGTGCLPAFPILRPHNHMWMDRCSDSEKMEAWYDGYEIGAMAAKGEGMGDANRIVTRTPRSTPVEYSPVGQNGVSDDGSFPPSPHVDDGALGGPQTRR